MNIYAIVILITLLLRYALELIADLLNLQALRPEPPAALQGVYDADAYRRSQAYTRMQTHFAWWATTFMLVVTLVFWFAGGFQALDQLVRRWHLGLIGTGLAYIGILVAARGLLSLPFRIYSTFVIEARFGFNTTTPLTFVADLLKGLGLAVLLGGLLLAGVLAFFVYAGTSAWLYCWLVTTLFMLGLQLLVPTWILPLFNTFTPLPQGALKEAILAYARSVMFPVDDVYVMDGSRRSSKSNAFFTGFGKHKRIALFDTLVQAHTVPELVAVVAHEVGHYKQRHILQRVVLSILHTGVMLFLLSVFLHHAGLFQAFYVAEPSIYTGLVFFGLLYAPVELLLSVFLQIVSRQHEYAADAYAVHTTDDPAVLAAALKKLAVHNLANLTPHPFYVFLHYSHPPIWQRLQAIQRLQAQVDTA
jgi:STE24 endopeptidase